MDVGTAELKRRRLRGFTLTAIFAALLVGVLALNWPISFASSGTSSATALQDVEASVADVAEEASKATVTVLNLQAARHPSPDDGDLDVVSSGSGYIVDQEGHVVTNYHVVAGGADFEVLLFDGTEIEAELVGSDPYQDVAVLQLELDAGEAVPGVLTFGDSAEVRAGDEVIAIGGPFGEFANTVTAGMVNGVDRALDTGYGYLLPNLIQHDAEIYPGDSGGPLLDADGDVIGMNVAKAVETGFGAAQDSSIGFAIESNAVKEIVDEIIADGAASRPYLGVRVEATRAGQVIVAIEEDSPAEVAGLHAGDVIIAIDGEEIGRDNPLLNALVFDHEPGEQVTIGVERDGERLEVTATLGQREIAA